MVNLADRVMEDWTAGIAPGAFLIDALPWSMFSVLSSIGFE
jgi:hypothetical protein